MSRWQFLSTEVTYCSVCSGLTPTSRTWRNKTLARSESSLTCPLQLAYIVVRYRYKDTVPPFRCVSKHFAENFVEGLTEWQNHGKPCRSAISAKKIPDTFKLSRDNFGILMSVQVISTGRNHLIVTLKFNQSKCSPILFPFAVVFFRTILNIFFTV